MAEAREMSATLIARGLVVHQVGSSLYFYTVIEVTNPFFLSCDLL